MGTEATEATEKRYLYPGAAITVSLETPESFPRHALTHWGNPREGKYSFTNKLIRTKHKIENLLN